GWAARARRARRGDGSRPTWPRGGSRPEDDVGGAGALTAVVASLVCPDDHVGQPVSVDVAGARHRPSRIVAGCRAVDPDAPRPEGTKVDVRRLAPAEDDGGRAGVRSPIPIGKGRSDDHVRESVPVDVPGTRDREARAVPRNGPVD